MFVQRLVFFWLKLTLALCLLYMIGLPIYFVLTGGTSDSRNLSDTRKLMKKAVKAELKTGNKLINISTVTDRKIATLKNNHGQQVPSNEDKSDGRSNDLPIILWWNWKTIPEGRKLLRCGDVKCWAVSDRNYTKSAQMFVMYGSSIDFCDLPPPRQGYQQWALTHDESPNNNDYMFSHPEVMEMFNFTSTFKRESDFPLTTRWLQDIASLEDKKYLVSTSEKNRLQREKGLALINYVNSNCGTFSDRDKLLTMIQRELKVDSYGKCLHNKDLPEHLRGLKGFEREEFYRIQAQYKFSFATENALCDDYITEKLWRPLMVGSVPVVLGSSKVRELLPTNHSAILVSDFKTVSELVAYLRYLNDNDDEYEKYLSFKTKHGVTNAYLRKTLLHRPFKLHSPTGPFHSDAFTCFLCERIHERMRRENEGKTVIRHQADVSHYGCPKPLRFSDNPPGNLQLTSDDHWPKIWEISGARAKALKQFLREGTKFTWKELKARANLIRKYEDGSLI